MVLTEFRANHEEVKVNILDFTTNYQLYRSDLRMRMRLEMPQLDANLARESRINRGYFTRENLSLFEGSYMRWMVYPAWQ